MASVARAMMIQRPFSRFVRNPTRGISRFKAEGSCGCKFPNILLLDCGLTTFDDEKIFLSALAHLHPSEYLTP
eukprot:787503-Amorphochlora_amoeboformis.AAC.2